LQKRASLPKKDVTTDQGTFGAVDPLKMELGCALDAGRGATVMSAEAEDRAEDRIAALRLAVDRLTQGLTLMLETQATHTEMLRQLLITASDPAPEESPVAEALTHLAATIGAQTLLLHKVSRGLERLPEEVGREVAGGLRAALGEVA
jgi:hypothetical protein